MTDSEPEQSASPSATDAPSPAAAQAPAHPKRKRKWIRRLGWFFLTLVVLYTLAIVIVRWQFSGPRLAKFISAKVLNPNIRGRIEIESVDWPLTSLLFPWRLGRVDVKITGIKVFGPGKPDPKTGLIPEGAEKNDLVLDIPYASGVIDAWAVVQPDATAWWWPFESGHHDLLVAELNIPEGTCKVEEYATPKGEFPAEIGFLSALDPNAAQRAKARQQTSALPGPTTWLGDIKLSHVKLDLLFFGWQARFTDMSTDGGTLRKSQRDPLNQFDFAYDLTNVRAATAALDIPDLLGPAKPLHIDFVKVDATKFLQQPGQRTKLEFDLSAGTTDAARVHALGALTNLYVPRGGGVEMTMDVTGAGALAARLSDGRARGDKAHARLTFSGPYSNTQIRVAAEAVDVDAGPDAPAIHVASVDADLFTGAAAGSVHELTAETLEGKIHAAGAYQLVYAPNPVYPWFTPNLCTLPGLAPGARPCWDLGVSVDPDVDTASLLPPDLLADITAVTANARLRGKLRFSGTAQALVADGIDLHLGTVAARGSATWSLADGIAHTDGIAVDVPSMAASASARGDVDTRKKTLALAFGASAKKLGPILRRFKQPALATSATARGTVRGPWAMPQTDATIDARGVPVVGGLDASITHVGTSLTINRLHSRPFGGEILGAGALRLGPRPSITTFRLNADGLDLARIPGMEQILSGTGKLHLEAEGPLLRPRAQLTASAADFTVSEEPLGEVNLALRTDEQGLQITTLDVSGRRSGGAFHVDGRIGYDTALDLTFNIKRLPLGTLPVVAAYNENPGPNWRLDGEASLSAHLGGDLADPDLDGTLALTRVAFQDTLFGAAQLILTAIEGKRDTNGQVELTGDLFQRKFAIEGRASLLPPFHFGVRLKFTQVEFDEFTPLLAELGARGWVTGYVDLELSDKSDKFWASLRVSELHMEIDGEDEHGRPRPVQIDNVNLNGEHPIAIAWDGATARLLEPVQLRGPNGLFTLAGSVGETTMDVSLNGAIELQLAEFFTRRILDAARGTATVDLKITGDPKKPQVRGTVVLKDASVTPRNQENVVYIPKGTITLNNREVAVDGLEVEVDGQTLNISGAVALDDWQPTTVAARVRGRLAAKLLEVVAGKAVTGAGGSALISLDLSGQADNPDIDGTLTFDSPFEVSPRGLRREIVLGRGKITFKDQQLTFDNVAGTVDEARFAISDVASGKSFVLLYQWQLVDMDVRLKLEGLTHRIPGLLEVEVNSDVEVFGDQLQLQVKGNIDVVDGVYQQRFIYAKLLVPVRTTERAPPFWQGNPLLENLLLDLKVRTTGTFRINTNIASDVYLTGDIDITGTPPDPRLDGRILMEDGTIKIPSIKPTFGLRNGSVTFSRFERAVEGTRVDVEADTIFTDTDDRQHTVRLRVWGPLSALNINLGTDDGMTFLQTLIMISFGKTPDQLRSQARGDDPGAPRDSGTGNTGISGDSGVASATDRLVKDFASDFISVLVEAPLKELTGLDCIRIEIGTESGLVYGCKKFGRSVKAEGDLEQGFRGGDRQRIGVNVKVQDNIYIIGDYQRRRPEDESQDVETRFKGQVKFRFVIP